jgi:hypothetical protein
VQGIGTLADDEQRLQQLRGVAVAGTLLRDGATLLPMRPTTGIRPAAATRFAILWPQLRTVSNGGLATSLNEGTLWAGRGHSAMVRTGFTAGMGPVRIVLAPELAYTDNRPFEVRAGQVPGWSGFSSPWRTATLPADLPVRFGDAPMARLTPGQSRVELSVGAVAAGISSANLWWGPGLRNALVLSNHADGIPHAFLRTARPLRTRVGSVEVRWIAGLLMESLYFDRDATNDRRALGGLVATWAPALMDGLTIGAARLVVTAGGPSDSVPFRAGQAALATVAGFPGDRPNDQMTSTFMRWVLPEDGFEFWGEYAVQQLPTLREWLTGPNADAGWTVGAQWLLPRPRPTDGTWRLQLEVTEVAQSQVFPYRAPRDWGTGNRVLHGFTQRGRMLGVSTGPGSSHWWFAMDRWASRWSLGGMLWRTRWENDAFYRERFPTPFAHDVSLGSGLRASTTAGGWRQQAVLSLERRYNYQFESSFLVPLRRGQRNVNNLRVEFTVGPIGARPPSR